jgi:5-methylcytosine-specific restriction endonuclease McrA
VQAFLDGRVTLHCGVCGGAFSVDASRLKHGRGKHCSPACQYEARRRQPKKAVGLTCIGCGSAFSLPPSKVTSHKGAGKYCSRPCRDRHWKGDKNPNWQNGDRVYKRGSHWHAIRRRIIARDKVCQHCGTDGPLHVHHVLPFRLFEDKDAANAESNLVALCPPCHRREDARSKWVPVGGGVLHFANSSEAWKLARERGMV